jgi:CRP-like cAMP-binding protein
MPLSDAPLRTAEPASSAGRQTRNKLLNLLPANELEAILAVSDVVTVKSKDILFRPGAQLSRVYFPEDCVVSLVVQLEGGGGVEAMTVGNDGFAPLAPFNGVDSTNLTGCGQITGGARRLSAGDFARVIGDCPELKNVLHLYSQLVFEAVAQSAACNRMHVVEQRCARWLLLSHDRVGRPSFDLTQAFLAEMLGVRRAGVTVAMGILARNGLISHTRGSVTIVDREGLESASCECYRAIKRRESRILA